MANPKAVRTIDGSPLTRCEVRDLNRSAKLMAKYGAISAERLAKLTRQSLRSALWCLLYIGAVPTASGLYVWP